MPNKEIGVRKWDKIQMRKAITFVRNNEMGIHLTAKTNGVPNTTLQHMARSDKSIEELLSNKEIEEVLVKYSQEMENRFWGLTRSDVRSLAFQMAQKNNIPNKFSILHKCAGKDWLYSFINRHKGKLSFRQPTGTSFDRAKGFTLENVDKFFDIIEDIYIKNKLSASRIWNVDETGLSIVQSKQPQILAKKGKRQIGAMTSAERGTLVTVINCMSASGNFIPPYFIFPRKNQNPLFMNNAPADSKAAFHISGWVQLPIFTEWFRHFLEFSKPSEQDPILLILDGHYSHTRNIEVIDLARQNNVIIISLPPHSTHKMQPLDRTFMGPLKKYYNEEIRRFIRETGRKVVLGDIAQLFKNAYLKVQTGQIAISGFKCTGIYPFDRSIFTEADFIAGDNYESRNETQEGLALPELNNQFNTNDSTSELTQVIQCPSTARNIVNPSVLSENIERVIPIIAPSTLLASNLKSIPSTSKMHLTPWDISPPPKIKKTITTNRGRKTQAAILQHHLTKCS